MSAIVWISSTLVPLPLKNLAITHGPYGAHIAHDRLSNILAWEARAEIPKRPAQLFLGTIQTSIVRVEGESAQYLCTWKYIPTRNLLYATCDHPSNTVPDIPDHLESI